MDTDMKIAAKPTAPLDDFVIEDPYYEWQKREGVRVIHEYVLEDLSNVELSPWARKGGAGAFINLKLRQGELPGDAQLIEIAPGRSANAKIVAPAPTSAVVCAVTSLSIDAPVPASRPPATLVI